MAMGVNSDTLPDAWQRFGAVSNAHPTLVYTWVCNRKEFISFLITTQEWYPYNQGILFK